jgi:hypothetical protein
MNNPSNLEMQFFPFHAKCTMQLSSETKEENERIFFLIFLLKCFQDEKKTKPYANSFSFSNNNAKQCKERKRPN